MGNSTGKQVKSGENTAAAASAEANKEAATTAPVDQKNDQVAEDACENKVVTENGNGEAATAQVEATTDDITVENGTTKDENNSPTEQTPAAPETKTKKKRNPVHWLRKNISFKKERRCGKTCEEKKETPAEVVATVEGDTPAAEGVVDSADGVDVATPISNGCTVEATVEDCTTEKKEINVIITIKGDHHNALESTTPENAISTDAPAAVTVGGSD